MKNRSKILTVLLAAALAAGSLAGCGQDSQDKETKAETQAEDKAGEQEETSGEDVDTAQAEGGADLEMWTFVELHGKHFEDMCAKWN